VIFRLFLIAIFRLIYFLLIAFPESRPLNIFLNVSLRFVRDALIKL